MTLTKAEPEAPETGLFVCPPDHDHGRRTTCYTAHKCRCSACRAKVAMEEKRRWRGKRDGTYAGKRGGARSRAHIFMLYQRGMTQKDLARRAGIAPSTLRNIERGLVKRVMPATERAILAIRPQESVGAGGRVDALGSRRRLQALIALGWTGVELSRRLGGHRTMVARMVSSAEITAGYRDAVHELFEELSATPAPDSPASKKARTTAAQRGWVPPLAWDDIDNPDEEPNLTGDAEGDDAVDEIAVERVIRGEVADRLNYAEKRYAVARLHPRRWSDQLIAKRLGIADKTVARIRDELELPAWSWQEQMDNEGQAA